MRVPTRLTVDWPRQSRNNATHNCVARVSHRVSPIGCPKVERHTCASARARSNSRVLLINCTDTSTRRAARRGQHPRTSQIRYRRARASASAQVLFGARAGTSFGASAPSARVRSAARSERNISASPERHRRPPDRPTDCARRLSTQTHGWSGRTRPSRPTATQ